ncbi:MAG TPA: ribose-5-phosphate isomerase [Micromonosporaceae bacterium]|nr:ribose-5-phosphate isomerase [Micromonosporaceae bacterium]
MRVYLAADHAGYELKVHLATYLTTQGYEVRDIGPSAFDPDDDYPSYCLHAGLRVVADPSSLGVVIGGSGNGEQIAANKVAGVRAALAWNVATAQLAREHNDANVVSIGARQHTLDEATQIVEAFLMARFSGDARHARRIDQITEYERTGQAPPLASPASAG